MRSIRRYKLTIECGVALAFACLSATISGCTSKAGAERVPPPPPVGVVEARQMTVPIMVEPIGTTRALQQVSVRARVRGFLKEMHFKEGGDVKAGQLLFVIDEEPFKAKLAEAKANLEAAEARLQEAKDSKAREVAAAQLAKDEAILALNKIEEGRQVRLRRTNAASQEDVDRAVAVRKRSEAEVEADKARQDESKADYDTGILSAKASVDAAKAALINAEIDLGYCRMSSPIDGRVGMAEVELGNLVGPTGVGGTDYTELTVVNQLDPMGVDIPAPSRYLERITRLIGQGLPIEIYQPGLEGEEAHRYAGKATVIDNTINPTTSTFLVRAEVANPQKTILPGEYVKIDAKVGEVKDATVVPEQAVVETQAGPTVYTVDKQGKVSVVPVRATFTHEGLRVLESGLEPGQDVIVEGMQMARAGMTVTPRKVSPDTLKVPEDSATAKPGATSSGAAKSGPPKKPEGATDSNKATEKGEAVTKEAGASMPKP